PPDPFVPEALEHAAVAVDALLGTGSTGAPRGAVAEAIEALGRAGAPVVAVDVPSGVDASTGEVAEPAVRADLTVTFHAAKPGLWIAPGKEHTGEVRVADIGIPSGAPVEPTIGLIHDEVLIGLPRRLAPGTKFTSGHVLVCGGSPGPTVALIHDLAARAPGALVIDADGLNAHAGELERLRGRGAPTVLTPHGGELARLLETDSTAVNARRLHHAREAARISGAIVVL